MRITDRKYDPKLVAGFQKTRARFGGLSNMAGGYPLVVNGICFASSEALYQACRFPFLPELQRKLAGIGSPMAAKMEAHRHVGMTRGDWRTINIAAMRWCLRIKLSQHSASFGTVLAETGDLPIVEISHKDDFWGARPQPDGTLLGKNVLGRLEMELRQQWLTGGADLFRTVPPPPVTDFLIGGEAVGAIAQPATSSVVPEQLEIGI